MLILCLFLNTSRGSFVAQKKKQIFQHGMRTIQTGWMGVPGRRHARPKRLRVYHLD